MTTDTFDLTRHDAFARPSFVALGEHADMVVAELVRHGSKTSLRLPIIEWAQSWEAWWREHQSDMTDVLGQKREHVQTVLDEACHWRSRIVESIPAVAALQIQCRAPKSPIGSTAGGDSPLSRPTTILPTKREGAALGTGLVLGVAGALLLLYAIRR